MVLGEMDFAGAKPPRPGSKPPVHTTTGTPPSSRRRPPNSGWGGGGGLEACLISGGRRPPSPDYIGRQGMGNGMRRGRKQGSVRRQFYRLSASAYHIWPKAVGLPSYAVSHLLERPYAASYHMKRPYVVTYQRLRPLALIGQSSALAIQSIPCGFGMNWTF